MAKTTFGALMQIPSAWLNKVFGANGHRHDGIDEDGHAPLDYATDSGTPNAVAAALTPPLTTHVEGLPIFVKIVNANTCGLNDIGAGALTRIGTTATAVLNAHGYSNGDWVVMSGAVQPEYNGVFQVSNVTANTYDYTVAGAPATPATGAITSTKAATFNPSGIGAKPIIKAGGAPLIPGDMGAGLIAILQYNGAQYELQNPVYPVLIYGADYGTVNNYMVKLFPSPVTRTKGMTIKFITANANTGASTINDGLGAVAIKKLGGVGLDSGDIKANCMVTLVFNGTDYQLGGDLVKHNHSDAYGGQLPASAISGILGARDNTKVKDTVYQAATDLMITYSVDGGGGAVAIAGYADGSNPPTTLRTKSGGTAAVPTYATIPMTVHKGEYWKVTIVSGGGSEVLSVSPIGG